MQQVVNEGDLLGLSCVQFFQGAKLAQQVDVVKVHLGVYKLLCSSHLHVQSDLVESFEHLVVVDLEPFNH